LDTATLPTEIEKAIEARKPNDIFLIRSHTNASFFKVTSVEDKPLTGDEAEQFAKRQLQPRADIDQESITMEKEGGIFVVPVQLNGAITLPAIVDSGAADVTVPADVVLTLMRTKTISANDFLQEKTYVLADGSEMPSQQFRIRSIKVGNRVVEDVIATITSVRSKILLGQSYLGRLKSWSIDNDKHVLNLN
jgi:clan AA aspartic protease (TIGR02281 family)